MIRKTLTEIKNELLSILINNDDLVKSLVILQKNFLSNNVVISDDEQELLDNPQTLIRDRIFPYKKTPDVNTESKVIISMMFNDFEPSGKYRDGYVNFYILCPYEYEKTNYGIRYDWIGDKIEEILEHNGIGTFELTNRGDVNVNDKILGHVLTFRTTNFWLVE